MVTAVSSQEIIFSGGGKFVDFLRFCEHNGWRCVIISESRIVNDLVSSFLVAGGM